MEHLKDIQDAGRVSIDMSMKDKKEKLTLAPLHQSRCSGKICRCGKKESLRNWIEFNILFLTSERHIFQSSFAFWCYIDKSFFIAILQHNISHLRVHFSCKNFTYLIVWKSINLNRRAIHCWWGPCQLQVWTGLFPPPW